MILRTLFAASTVATLLVTPVAFGQVLISNLGDASTGITDVGFNNQGIGQAFTVGASGLVGEDVRIAVGSSTFGPGNFQLSLYSDAGLEPGSLLQTLTGSSNPTGGFGPGAAYFDYYGSVTLQPSTTYWVVASSGSYYEWITTSSATATGSGTIGAAALDNLGNWTPQANYQQFSVSSVPEPASSSAAAAGVLLVGALAWRMRRR